MNDNLYLMDKCSDDYRERCLKEAEHSRLLRSISAASSPAWRPLVLLLAHGLIAIGQSLEHTVELRSQPPCKTC